MTNLCEQPVVRILDPGPATTIQDAGRAGFAHLGITASGPADRAAAALANRLAGNVEGAALFENLMGGLVLTVSEGRYVAVAGAPAAVRIDGVAVNEPQRVFLPAGAQMRVDRPWTGLRIYVAIAGGIEAQRAFGSSSTDTLSALGPPALAAGDELALGPATAEPPDIPLELAQSHCTSAELNLRMRWGPRDDCFAENVKQALTTSRWTVGVDSNRVGVSLTGNPLPVQPMHVPSEGMVIGAVQVPASGLPIVFLADHPVTGGYPVIGVITEADLGQLAQATPGTPLRLTPLDHSSALVRRRR